ncbi:MAG: hypothetical protein WDZ74_01035 [Candidatus Paceibacterota bacterium]
MKVFILLVVTALVSVSSNSVLVSAQTSAEAEAQAEVGQSEETRENDADSDGDGLGDLVEEGDDLLDALDSDDDSDGVPTALPTKPIDKASPKLMEVRAGGGDQTTPLLYQGLRVRGELCGEDADCNDDDADITPEQAENELWVRVSGSDVRGMSAEAKAQVRERLSVLSETNTANDFGLRVASAALENESITEILTNDEETEVHYRTRIHLFGFIPMTANAVARANTEGEVRVRYPWYRFLSRVSDEETMKELALELRASHNVLIETEGDDDLETQ